MDVRGLNLSMSSNMLANSNTRSAASAEMLNKTLDNEKMNGQALTRMLERSVNPMVGQNIDIRI